MQIRARAPGRNPGHSRLFIRSHSTDSEEKRRYRRSISLRVQDIIISLCVVTLVQHSSYWSENKRGNGKLGDTIWYPFNRGKGFIDAYQENVWHEAGTLIVFLFLYLVPPILNTKSRKGILRSIRWILIYEWTSKSSTLEQSRWWCFMGHLPFSQLARAAHIKEFWCCVIERFKKNTKRLTDPW